MVGIPHFSKVIVFSFANFKGRCLDSLNPTNKNIKSPNNFLPKQSTSFESFSLLFQVNCLLFASIYDLEPQVFDIFKVKIQLSSLFNWPFNTLSVTPKTKTFIWVHFRWLNIQLQNSNLCEARLWVIEE